MLGSYLSLLGLFIGLPLVSSTPVPIPEPQLNFIDGNPKDACSSFGYMSMGQLEVYNNYGEDLRISLAYKPNQCTGVFSSCDKYTLGTVKSGSWYEFDRDSDLRGFKRDTDVWLLVCSTAWGAFGCTSVPGKFRIPPVGAKQWVAHVDLNPKLCKSSFECMGVDTALAPTCLVDRSMRDAWYP